MRLRPRLLFRYIFLQNVVYMLIALAVGVGIFILADLFERVDIFLASDLSLLSVVWYYILRLPTMISMILPACFLLATLVQLALMARSKELVALQAGGVSLARIALCLFLCGAFFGAAQFVFAEAVGARAEREARSFWQEDVRKRSSEEYGVWFLWFEDSNYKVYLGELLPRLGRARHLSAYEMSEDGTAILRVVRASASVHLQSGDWRFSNAEVFDMRTYNTERMAEISLPLQVSPEDFAWYDNQVTHTLLPIWELGELIQTQRAAGSNVESLQTSWHMKISSAAALMALALLAVAVITWQENVYLCVAIGFAATFLLYVMNSISPTLGAYGILSPFWAAWYPILVVFLVGAGRLLWFHWPHKLKPVAEN